MSDRDARWLQKETGAAYRDLLRLKRRFHRPAWARAWEQVPDPDDKLKRRDAYHQALLKMVKDHWATKETPLIICLTGPQMAGKTILAEQLAAAHGFTIVREEAFQIRSIPAGDVVIDCARTERGLQYARANQMRVVHICRKKEGTDLPPFDGDFVFRMPELGSCETGSPALLQAADALLRKLR